MKAKIVYKVVNDKLQSAMADHYSLAAAKIQYVINKYVSPKIEGTLLLAFESPQAASNYASVNSDIAELRIFKARAFIEPLWGERSNEMFQLSPYILDERDIIECIIESWSHYVENGWPDGTVCCSRIKLIEEIM